MSSSLSRRPRKWHRRWKPRRSRRAPWNQRTTRKKRRKTMTRRMKTKARRNPIQGTDGQDRITPGRKHSKKSTYVFSRALSLHRSRVSRFPSTVTRTDSTQRTSQIQRYHRQIRTPSKSNSHERHSPIERVSSICSSAFAVIQRSSTVKRLPT